MITKTVPIIIIAIIAVASANAKAKPNPQAQTTKFLRYQNPDFHLKIQYSSNWTKEETGLSTNTVVKFTNWSSNVVFKVAAFRPLSKDFTSDDFAIRMSDNVPDIYYLNASIGIPLAGTKASQVIYYAYPSGLGNLKVLETVLIKDNTVYSLMYYTDPPLFNRYLPIARGMINSFQFTK
jgi:hypothetical protein